jgi:hypothetical protein
MKTITLTLTEEQEKVMTKAVNLYGITLEQACAYGFFNFEFRLDPSSGDDCWYMIDSLLDAKDPDRAFVNRFKADLPGWMKDSKEEPKEASDNIPEDQGNKAA